ncbi:polysaccharide biosynthesis/export family protein [Edaphobacter bradus]|uniref:polysaccharide biosynthesis/export family protein n=1 Tax=Edaphobacter bradus TaxID=2259016 RepID=UPI0021E0E20D|nr:polysaccharide biosynthesis/export family protein [Edaphobacter bradus]
MDKRSYLMNRLYVYAVYAALFLLIVTIKSNAQPQTPAGSVSPAAAAPAPPAANKPVQSALADPSTYVIGSEDVLQVTVWREPTLSGTIPVRPDGMISLVLVGDMPAAGRTPMQLAGDISVRLKKYVQDPSVSVVVTAVNSQRIFLIGEVGHVGPVPLTAGMSPLQAISAAGGLTPFANSKHIYILRGAQGKQQKIPFNYKAALKGDSHQDITLLPGDTIVVP